jgi:hypothetical protein
VFDCKWGKFELCYFCCPCCCCCCVCSLLAVTEDYEAVVKPSALNAMKWLRDNKLISIERCALQGKSVSSICSTM